MDERMSDYIKREDALDIVADNNVTGEITLNRYDKIIDGIYDIPSADVAPVRHGRWKTYKTEVAGRGFFYCTKCRTDAYNATDYCPNCGAKMDREDNNE